MQRCILLQYKSSYATYHNWPWSSSVTYISHRHLLLSSSPKIINSNMLLIVYQIFNSWTFRTRNKYLWIGPWPWHIGHYWSVVVAHNTFWWYFMSFTNDLICPWDNSRCQNNKPNCGGDKTNYMYIIFVRFCVQPLSRHLEVFDTRRQNITLNWK